MAKRHLPVLREPAAAGPQGAAPDASADPPPWHWIPLGTVISVVSFALLAQGAARLAVAVLGRVYPPNATAAQIAALRAADPTRARGHELVAGAIPVVALLLSVALGAFVIGRYGDRTNQRHGTLSGAVTALVFWAVTGWMPSMLLMVPLAMVTGWAAAKGGLALRERA